MRIRTLRGLLALGVVALSAAGVEAAAPAAAPPEGKAPDYATIVLSVDVHRPADEVWKKVGGFCDIGTWMKVKCVYTSGSGDLGTVRRLMDRIDEVMVAKTRHSYTYTQPTTKILYHGTVEVEPAGAHASKIIYSIFYDDSGDATDEAKARDREQRTKMFTGALESMKKLAEGG